LGRAGRARAPADDDDDAAAADDDDATGTAERAASVGAVRRTQSLRDKVQRGF
jgi:hypothetical protein